MKSYSGFYIFISLTCILLLLIIPIVSMAQQSDTQQATEDARRDVEQNFSPLAWGAGGFMCGICGFAYAYWATPELPIGRLIGKSPTYVNTYTLIYRQETKRQRMQAVAVGCGIGSAVSTLSYYLFVLPQLQQLQNN